MLYGGIPLSEPFLAEMRIFGFSFAPRGWAECNGQIIAIGQNQSLFSLLGTIYGGDGRTTFALPDMRSRVPTHPGAPDGGLPLSIGGKTGEENHVLTTPEMPIHTHELNGSSDEADEESPSDSVLATSPNTLIDNYSPSTGSNLVSLSSQGVGSVGGGRSHTNMQPYLALNFCIALQGVYPSRS